LIASGNYFKFACSNSGKRCNVPYKRRGDGKERIMDIGSVGAVSSALTQAKTGDAVAISVMKKAIDLQAQGALQLIQALPQPAAVNGVGGNINTYA
jgi:hypothetical protein